MPKLGAHFECVPVGLGALVSLGQQGAMVVALVSCEVPRGWLRGAGQLHHSCCLSLAGPLPGVSFSQPHVCYLGPRADGSCLSEPQQTPVFTEGCYSNYVRVGAVRQLVAVSCLREVMILISAHSRKLGAYCSQQEMGLKNRAER